MKRTFEKRCPHCGTQFEVGVDVESSSDIPIFCPSCRGVVRPTRNPDRWHRRNDEQYIEDSDADYDNAGAASTLESIVAVTVIISIIGFVLQGLGII